MDSLPGEDPTLPLEFSGSASISCLSDVLGDDVRIRVGGGGALPDVAEDTVSPTRARTMKDFENQITELRKENFNLKLRIYFLEERMQQKFDGPSEEVYRIVGVMAQLCVDIWEYAVGPHGSFLDLCS